ncbi:MAG: DoxX family protein [Acidobacteriota bacterium]|nr:DoxX family protein [Acidobacteriota bacterium]
MSTSLNKGAKIASWVAQLVVAVILLQTLYFKFTAAPEPVWIFQQLGVEPWGRIATGILELIAGLAILVPATVVLGALLSAGLMVGAILSHLTVLGIEVQNDGGTLFVMALVVFAASLVVLWIRRRELPVVGDRF